MTVCFVRSGVSLAHMSVSTRKISACYHLESYCFRRRQKSREGVIQRNCRPKFQGVFGESPFVLFPTEVWSRILRRLSGDSLFIGSRNSIVRLHVFGRMQEHVS